MTVERIVSNPLMKALLLCVSLVTSFKNVTAQVKVPAAVKVEVFNSVPVFYTIPWAPNMSVLNAMEQALPTTSPAGSFSVGYFPQFNGYFVSTVGGVPAAGVKKYWSSCLLPAGAGSTIFSLPLAPNRVMVGPGDIVVLALDTDCTKVPTVQK